MDTNPRFKDGAYASVVLEFYRWDNFFIIRPDYRDKGFLRPLRRDNVVSALNSLHVPRDLAVVVMGWNYSPKEIALAVENWKSLLRAQGFRRIVCLRANENNKLDGKVIIDDWKQSVDEPKQTAKLQ